MAVVVNFGSEISYAIFDKNKVTRNVKLVSFDSDVVDGEELKSLLENLIDLYPDILHEPVYVTFTAGSGVVYKTFSIGQESVMVNGTRTTNIEKQNAARELIDNYKPFGLEGDYVSTVLTEYKTDTDYVLSCAYYPASALEKIRKVFAEVKISVLDMQPLVYGVYKALDMQTFRQLIVDCGDELMLVNPLGVIVWGKPVDFDKDIANQYLITQSQVSYGIDPEVAETVFVDNYRLLNYLMPGFVSEAGPGILGPAAFGIIGKISRKKSKKGVEVSVDNSTDFDDVNPIMNQKKKKGGLKDVIAQLRLLFDTKGKE